MTSTPDIAPPDDRRHARLRSFDARERGRFAGLPRSPRLFRLLMRFGLPLIAAVLFGLVVVWPMLSGNESGFRIGFVDADSLDSGPLRMVNARYLGTDEKNQPYTVTADAATQQGAETDVVDLVNPKADITLEDESWIALTAQSGVYRREAEILDLAGRVSLYSDSGFEMHTESARLALAHGTAEGQEPVDGQGPMGLLSASGFRMSEKGRHLFFTGPVTLVIYPDAKEDS